MSSRIFVNVTAKWTSSVKQFLLAKNYLQNSHYKNQECSHCFFLFSSFLPPLSSFLSLRYCVFRAQ